MHLDREVQSDLDLTIEAEGMVGAVKQGRDAVGRTDEVSHGIEVLARLGYAAKGIVYVGVGLLTAAAAFQVGTRSQTGSTDASGSRDALAAIGSATWGSALLAAVAIGMAGYVAWRVVQALFDPEGLGTDAKGLATRAVLLISGAIYGGLGLWIVRRILGMGSGSDGNARSWSATLLQQPFGAWLLGAFGLAVMAYGIAEWVKAARASFEKRMRSDLNGDRKRLVRRIARVGLVSRGICFLIVGGFLVFAAQQSNASEARGLEGALEALGSQAYGPWVMGLVALGLVAYGVLQWVKAWYRCIGPVST